MIEVWLMIATKKIIALLWTTTSTSIRLVQVPEDQHCCSRDFHDMACISFLQLTVTVIECASKRCLEIFVKLSSSTYQYTKTRVPIRIAQFSHFSWRGWSWNVAVYCLQQRVVIARTRWQNSREIMWQEFFGIDQPPQRPSAKVVFLRSQPLRTTTRAC